MNHRLSWLIIVLSLAGAGLWATLAALTPADRPQLDAEVQAALARSDPAPLAVLVYLRDQTNLRSITTPDRARRQREVILALQATAQRSQRAVRAWLDAPHTTGQVLEYTPLWIINAIAVKADRAVLAALARRTDVSRIALDAVLPAPARLAPRAPLTGTPAVNLGVINAPALWALGYTGQGVVVGLMDTGADVTHPDLHDQWRGGTNSWYSPYEPASTVPYDPAGHGTQVLGVMVGRSGSGGPIGVAPDAQWIAAKIYDDFGSSQVSKVHLAFQWMLDPDGDPDTADAPRVVNGSWGLGNVNACNLTFQPDLQALVAAGIVPVFAAGDYGSGTVPTSISPANNPEAFSVGATNNLDAIWPSSSRGPTTCGGSARVFPDVVAPGVAITTTDILSSYVSVLGTSLSAPHVSGAVALLLSAFPTLTVGMERDALISTALDLGTPGPDNTFGAGRINALAAYQAIRSGAISTSTPTPTPTPTPTATPTTTPTPTNSPTPTASPTATPTVPPVFVPMVRH